MTNLRQKELLEYVGKMSDKEFIESCYLIIDKERKEVPFIFNTTQRLLYERMRRLNIVLKYRKPGVSVMIQSLMLTYCIRRKNQNGVVLSFDKDSTQRMLERTNWTLNHLPFHIPLERESKNEFKVVDTNSKMFIGVAGSKAFGRGDDITFLHVCLSGDAIVLLRDGMTKKISEVTVGDIVYTHSSNYAQVKAISKKKCDKISNHMRRIFIKGNHHFPVTATPDHKFLVRGQTSFQVKSPPPVWKKAKDIKPGDWMAMPRRDYKSKKHFIEMSKNIRIKSGHGGVVPKIEKLTMDGELGFFFGLYLAEGSIKFAKSRPNAIDISLHRKENNFVRRVKNRLKNIATFGKSYNKNSKTMILHTYNASLARTVNDLLGHKEKKRIPDIFWRGNRAFLDGLVEGYISGDGYIHPKFDQITVASIRPQLLVQLRDLLASLYFGWSHLEKKEAGFHYGRNCKECWNLHINGQTAFRIRQKFGWKLYKRSRKPGTHWRFDRNYIYIEVLANEVCEPEEYVYDLVLDHPDHSFRLLSCTSHNSEQAWWENQEVLTGILEALTKDAIVFVESTGNGPKNLFATLYRKGKSGKSEWFSHFFPWWIDPELARDVPADFAHTDEEKILKVSYNLNDRQLAWRRWKIANMVEPELFPQEFPANDSEAFIVLGDCVFNLKALSNYERLVKEPEHIGYLNLVQ